jgi:hypothetical protein
MKHSDYLAGCARMIGGTMARLPQEDSDFNELNKLDAAERNGTVLHPEECPGYHVVDGKLVKCLGVFDAQAIVKMRPEDLETLEGGFCPYCGTKLI